jgi:hypothetical protein
MFVKLNFSTNRSWDNIKHIVNAIINDTTIDSIPELIDRASTWNEFITQGLEYSSSEIIRTVEPTNVKSHFAASSSSARTWNLEFQVYDNPNKKYYINFSGPGHSIGDTILTGSMDSDQAVMTANVGSGSIISGTPVILSGAAPAKRELAGTSFMTSSTSIIDFKTFWMYLNNDCLILAFTLGPQQSNLGFNADYGNSSRFLGPFIYSQYTRYDYHNTNENGIIPLIYSNIRRTPLGQPSFGAQFGNAFDWTRIENSNYSGPDGTAFKVFNIVDAHPKVGSDWPIIDFPQVNWGSGTRTTEILALTAQTAGSVTTITASTVGPLIYNNISSPVRWPSADLKTLNYAMLPLRWSNTYYFNMGGNASNRGGFYIFNGDYFPGDTFTHEEKTYMIWPTFSGYDQRVGLAIPKE